MPDICGEVFLRGSVRELGYVDEAGVYLCALIQTSSHCDLGRAQWHLEAVRARDVRKLTSRA